MIDLFLTIQVLASSSDDGDAVYWLLAAGPLAGYLFYLFTFRRYRNVDKRNTYESSAKVRATLRSTRDAYVKRVNRSRASKVKNRNSGLPTWRVGDKKPSHAETGEGFSQILKNLSE